MTRGCGDGARWAFVAETKMDGERFTFHKYLDGYRLISNYPTTPGYGVMAEKLNTMLDLIGVEKFILDGEVLAWDPEKKCYIEFGHNRTAAKKELNRPLAGGGGSSQWVDRSRQGDDDSDEDGDNANDEHKFPDGEEMVSDTASLKYVVFDVLYIDSSVPAGSSAGAASGERFTVAQDLLELAGPRQ